MVVVPAFFLSASAWYNFVCVSLSRDAHYTYKHMHTYTYAYVHTHIYIYAYVYVYMCVYVFVCVFSILLNHIVSGMQHRFRFCIRIKSRFVLGTCIFCYFGIVPFGSNS